MSVCVCVEGGREGLVEGGKERKRERERKKTCVSELMRESESVSI